MMKLLHGYCVACLRCAPAALAFLVAGCAGDDSQAGGPAGPSAGPFSGGGGQVASPGNGSGGASAGTVGEGINPSFGSGGTATASGGGAGTELGAGGSGALSAGTGGTGEVSVGAGGTGTTAGVLRTVELIGPGAATCGATNATHGDGFVCVLNYPNEGPNVVGYWFDYAFTEGTCNLGFTKPTGNADANPQVCFSGSACPATSGGGLGVALCDVHGIDVSTWPELAMLETVSSLSSTLKSPVSGCNAGATIPSISWTLGSGSLPAGTSVLFDDAADVTVARVDNLAAGATSVDLPANVDATKVATIKFSVNGATSDSWSFCLTSLTVSLR